MARDFIFELKELKRFSEQDDKRDYLDEEIDQVEEEERLRANMKRKYNKCTQTVQLFFSKKTGKSKKQKPKNKYATSVALNSLT